MNVKFGTKKRRMLTIFVNQSIDSLGIIEFLTDVNPKVHLFNQIIKNIILTLYYTRLFLVMIEIPHG